jgi:hypothetical protein
LVEVGDLDARHLADEFEHVLDIRVLRDIAAHAIHRSQNVVGATRHAASGDDDFANRKARIGVALFARVRGVRRRGRRDGRTKRDRNGQPGGNGN